MIFILTCSQDGASNILIPHLNDQRVFRFNIDKPDEYSWHFFHSSFEIANVKTHTSINAQTLSSFYLRKPIYLKAIDIPKEGSTENWCRNETLELFRDFYRECESQRLTRLVNCRDQTFGKIRQMKTAKNYFSVPDWHIFHGMLPKELNRGRWVVKSLTGASIGNGKLFLVKEVDPTKLDLAYPWFMQEKIDGEDEVTVVYVCGKLFAYRYPRSKIAGCDDVRKASLEDPSQWQSCELTAAEQSAIRGFMAETGYSFGRFDFIRKDGELWFLELNPNGQWAWLDEKNNGGLISAIADAIIAEDLRHQRMADARRPSLLARLRQPVSISP